MVSIEDVKGFARDCFAAAKKIREEDGTDIYAQLFFMMPDGRVMAADSVGTDWRTLRTSQLAEFTRSIAEYVGAKFVIYVNEAWMTIIPEEEMGTVGRISDRPDKREVIVVTADGPGLTFTVTAEIVGGKVRTPVETDSFMGTLSNLSGQNPEN